MHTLSQARSQLRTFKMLVPAALQGHRTRSPSSSWMLSSRRQSLIAMAGVQAMLQPSMLRYDCWTPVELLSVGGSASRNIVNLIGRLIMRHALE